MKIIQMVHIRRDDFPHNSIYGLADDGSIWFLNDRRTEWIHVIDSPKEADKTTQ